MFFGLISQLTYWNQNFTETYIKQENSRADLEFVATFTPYINFATYAIALTSGVLLIVAFWRPEVSKAFYYLTLIDLMLR